MSIFGVKDKIVLILKKIKLMSTSGKGYESFPRHYLYKIIFLRDSNER